MRPHEPGRSSGRATRLGRGGGANGRQGSRKPAPAPGAGYAAGSAWPLPGRLRRPAWPAHKRRSGRPPLREERPAAAGPALPPGKGGAAAARAVSADYNLVAARRKTWGRMTRARRGNAVLAHPCAYLNGHFVRNGDKRA